jgi:hypothetical protein
MRASWHRSALAAIAFAMVVGAAAGAQTVPCVSGGLMGAITYGIQSSKESAPFSGIVKTSFEQKLADGNAIHRVTRTRQARDSAGRTMTEMAQGCVRGEDGQMHERLNINVNDPVARTNTNWQVGPDDQPKVVHVFHQPEPLSQPLKREELSAAELERQQKMRKAAQAAQLAQRKETKREDLGVKDINGVSAQGTRTTRTIAAGEEGNDQPLVVMDEMWRSKELGLVVMAIRDDPRTGRSVTEYEELTRGEPDPGLFAPPAGYTVQEQPQNGIMGGMIGGIVTGGLLP